MENSNYKISVTVEGKNERLVIDIFNKGLNIIVLTLKKDLPTERWQFEDYQAINEVAIWLEDIAKDIEKVYGLYLDTEADIFNEMFDELDDRHHYVTEVEEIDHDWDRYMAGHDCDEKI